LCVNNYCSREMLCIANTLDRGIVEDYPYNTREVSTFLRVFLPLALVSASLHTCLNMLF